MNNCYGVIYKITNIITKKSYVGQTVKHRNPYARIRRHFRQSARKDLVYESFKKRGISAFTWEILASATNQTDLDFLERHLIAELKTLVPMGYNIQLGGNGRGKFSNETKLKISQSNRERNKNRIHPLKGRKFTKEHCDNLSKVRKGFTSEKRQIAHRTMTEKSKIPVRAINKKTGESLVFESIQLAAETLGVQGCNISRVMNGSQNRKQHKGWKFEKA